MDIQYGSIEQWPGELRTTRVRAPFKRSTFTSTLKLLDRELRMISANGILCQLAISLMDLTRDGQIRANASPKHPGVILSFRKPVQRPGREMIRVPLNFPCDRFTHWQDNLRAIAIALEDLRRIDRYGVTQNGQQYFGFKSLPPPGPTHEKIETVEDAARFVANGNADTVIKSADAWRQAYRERAAKAHPDAGGLPDDWERLQAAKTLLDAHHKI